MSESLNQVIERASVDASFLAQLQGDPTGALAGYDLTPEERAAMLSGDPGRIGALGLDARVSKIDNPAAPGDAFPSGPFAGGTD
jgi:hypothetical protein